MPINSWTMVRTHLFLKQTKRMAIIFLACLKKSTTRMIIFAVIIQDVIPVEISYWHYDSCWHLTIVCVHWDGHEVIECGANSWEWQLYTWIQVVYIVRFVSSCLQFMHGAHGSHHYVLVIQNLCDQSSQRHTLVKPDIPVWQPVYGHIHI